jgi:hypothetical protein
MESLQAHMRITYVGVATHHLKFFILTKNNNTNTLISMTYDKVASSIEGIFKVLIPIADKIGLNEIKISKARAREILSEITRIKNEKSKANSKHIKREPLWLTNPD